MCIDAAAVVGAERSATELIARSERVECVVMDAIHVETYRAEVTGPAARGIVHCGRDRRQAREGDGDRGLLARRGHQGVFMDRCVCCPEASRGHERNSVERYCGD